MLIMDNQRSNLNIKVIDVIGYSCSFPEGVIFEIINFAEQFMKNEINISFRWKWEYIQTFHGPR